MKNSAKTTFGLLLALLTGAVVLGILKGSTDISASDLFKVEYRQILLLRISRVLLACIAGAGLAVCGVVLQAMLRNPLAEPYLLGTSGGAGLGAVLAVMSGAGMAFLPVAAFIGAIASVVIVYVIAKEGGGRIPVPSLILAGVIMSIALSGIIVFFVSVSSNEALHGLLWWLWGSFEIYDLGLLAIVSVIVVLGIAVIGLFNQELNAMSIGEEEAIHLGIRTETVKKILFVVTSLITASLVSVCGMIGFVGLIVPHAMRFVVGANHKKLLPLACLFGAAFVVLCDLASRTLFAPSEIPIGVITALIGAPAFVVLLKKKQAVK